MHASVAIVIVVVLLVVAVLWIARSRATRGRKKARPREGVLYRQLLGRVLGDRQVADRLVAYERERAPDTSESERIRRATQRLDRDRR
jgi:type II secretory pathway pseudopilin PulG